MAPKASETYIGSPQHKVVLCPVHPKPKSSQNTTERVDQASHSNMASAPQIITNQNFSIPVQIGHSEGLSPDSRVAGNFIKSALISRSNPASHSAIPCMSKPWVSALYPHLHWQATSLWKRKEGVSEHLLIITGWIKYHSGLCPHSTGTTQRGKIFTKLDHCQ